MIRSIEKEQTVSGSEGATAAEERAARHLRMLARLGEIGMEVAEAIRSEALEAPQPGVDYGGRVAVISRSVRLTILTEDEIGRRREERRHQAETARAEASRQERRHRHRMQVVQAVVTAIATEAGSAEEADQGFLALMERLERPEVLEAIDILPAEYSVERLCRALKLPEEEAERWLRTAAEMLSGAETPLPAAPRPRPPRPPARPTSRRRPRPRSRPAAPETG